MGIKLVKKIFITGTIETKTGLSVGGSSVGLEIGGADKVVLRNPLTNQPYIPGSSLKGKMRSLTEKMDGHMSITVKAIKKDKEGKEKVVREETYNRSSEISSSNLEKKEGEEEVRISAMPCKCGNCLVCSIFGVPAEEEKGQTSRLIVRDSDLIGIMENNKVEKGESAIRKLLNSRNTDMPYTEVKTEVVIDRITAAATPRNFERVPAGAVFGLNIVCNIYEGDDVNQILSKVFEGLRLVQDDYIGGSGTRGYGQVKFTIEELEYKDQDSYEQDKPAQRFNEVPIPQELQRG